ncbi:MAG: biotin-dependent carboxyltransferase family protein [Rhizobium sp.]
MIEILTTGAANTVQDLGRFGYLDAGVGRSGAMDGLALELANLLLGNAANAAGLEVTLFPFRLKVHVPCAIAVTGADCPVTLGGRAFPSWWVLPAGPGDVLEVGLPRSGARASLAFSGGIDVPVVLGSRSTDLKSGWGGLEGRGLNRGDRLAPGNRSFPGFADLPAGFGMDPTSVRAPLSGVDADEIGVRVLPSAEYLAFTDEARAHLAGAAWEVSAEANRQGYRLVGPELAMKEKRELFSHGIMPGTVQVPPSGQPIIQLAEANTCGGYPKIANVIEADLWRLAQAAVGARLRFIETTREEAITALRAQRAAIAGIAATAALVRKDKKLNDRGNG